MITSILNSLRTIGRYHCPVLILLTLSTVAFGQGASSRPYVVTTPRSNDSGHTTSVGPPAGAILKQFFTGQYSPELLQNQVNRARQTPSPLTSPSANSPQPMNNSNYHPSYPQQHYIPPQPMGHPTDSPSYPQQQAVSSQTIRRRAPERNANRAPSEYRQMIDRLSFSLDGLGKVHNENELPSPSSKAVMARFLTGQRNEEMNQWRNQYLELAAQQSQEYYHGGQSHTAEHLLATQNSTQMAPQTAASYAAVSSPVSREPSATGIALASFVQPSVSQSVNDSIAPPVKEQEIAIESHVPGKMKVFRPND